MSFSAPIGSFTSPVKRALMEMTQFGALVRNEGSKWRSCNGAIFYHCTIATLMVRDLAIISYNVKKPGSAVVRLNDDGIRLGRALLQERRLRALARDARQKAISSVLEAMAR